MIMWNKLDPKLLLIEVLGFDKKEKNHTTLAGACEQFVQAPGLLFPNIMGQFTKKIQTVLNSKRLIKSITVGDAMKIFETFIKGGDRTYAYRIRATLLNVVRYAYSGQLPEAKPKTVGNESGDQKDEVGKLKFSVANLADVAYLVPLYTTTGRFGWVKAEVQRMIFSLKPGQAGMIEAPKRSMDVKEAKSMQAAVTKMLSKGKLPWVIKYNPNETAFILLRESDHAKLVSNNKKGE